MSEIIIPEEQVSSDVLENKETVDVEPVNYAEKTLGELSELFQKLGEGVERIKKSKEAEAIKSAFYKRLSKEKAEAGLSTPVVEPSADEPVVEAAPEAAEEETRMNPFEAIEAGFKSLYNDFKKERAEYNKQLEKEREDNLSAKQAVIEELKALVEKQEDVNATFPAFREIQAKWRAIGPVPAQNFRDVNDSYQYYVEKFYDMVKINRDLRDLDFKKNLEAKQAFCEAAEKLSENENVVEAFRELQNRWREAGPVPATAYRNINDTYQFFVEKFYDMIKINRDLRDLDFKKNLEAKMAFCEAAEKLAENENVVNAFHELQKLHEQWKEFGPVAKEFREDIWNRFKAATAVVNKRYQAHFEELKGQQEENLKAKTTLCERLEEIAAKEVTTSGEWNALSKEIEDIQAEWRKIGFATKKENQKIYDRFRAACDAFFARKRDFYNEFKDNMNENLEKKLDLIKQAEELKLSTDWKKATDQFIALQKQWKEIGAVPRKKSEQLWKKFRGACDEFFASRDANSTPENDFYGNLKAKKKLIEDILAYEAGEDETANSEALRTFNERWQAIGHVPFKEKDNISKAFKDAMQQKFPLFNQRNSGTRGTGKAPRSPKDILIEKYHALQQDIATYENNIGFFSASKNSAPLIKQMQERIEQAKAELKDLESQIRKSEEGEQ